MIHIFIGTRLAAIAKSGEKMDTTTKAINWGSVIGGMIIGALTGFFIYRRLVNPNELGPNMLISSELLLVLNRLKQMREAAFVSQLLEAGVPPMIQMSKA